MDGFYQISFRGAADWGIGLLIFNNGAITGVDVGGALYDGSYYCSDAIIHSKIKLTVPPGVSLVQGVPAQKTEYAIDFSVDIPISSLNNAAPILIQLPVGPVNVVFTKLRGIS